MLTVAEIRHFMDEDAISDKKKQARQGQAYYEGDHDIKQYRVFYYDGDGKLVEDKERSYIKIPHPFFTELVDQAVQYMLSGKDGFIKSDIPELQDELDYYFNDNEDFISELSETLTGCMVKGFDYMHSFKNEDDRTAFEQSDSIGVVEVRAKDTDDKTEYIIYWYVDRIEKGQKKIKRIQVWDSKQVHYFVQTDEGEIEKDDSEKNNPKPHMLYEEEKGGAITYEEFGFIPFFRIDNNKKQFSDLKPIKPLIDDYDLMASSLSNNLQDFDTPLHVVRGFQGDNLDELQRNLRTKKVVGVDAEGGIDVQTVDVPYAARQAKMELDEKNIYRFGMGLNTSGLKDSSATTNIQIKAMYSLLDLKCTKLTLKLKKFLRKLIHVVLAEINMLNGTDYQQKDVYFEFEHEIMSNAMENAQIDMTEAQTKQVMVNTILNVAMQIGEEEALKAICEILELDYDEIQSKLQAAASPEGLGVEDAQSLLDETETEEELSEEETGEEGEEEGISEDEQAMQDNVIGMLDGLLADIGGDEEESSEDGISEDEQATQDNVIKMLEDLLKELE